jgi:hypothetical protein
MRRRQLLLTLGFGLAASSCGLFPTGVKCTTAGRVAVVVLLRDSITLQPAHPGATVVARDGAYADSVVFPAGQAQGFSPAALGPNRAGTYAVTVTKSGHRPWARGGIVAGTDRCGVVAVQLTALLQPL